MLELFLFENDVGKARQAIKYGVHHFLVDWESVGKKDRQQGYDTEILPGTLDDLCAISAIQDATTWCRINRYGPHTMKEIESALNAGAAGIFLPMVTSLVEVEEFLRLVDTRCATGVLIETAEAYTSARFLATLPFDRVYFGLNDFAISRGGGSIFRAVLDGSVERMREVFGEKIFGFGGVTAIETGVPLPAIHLLEEMARLDCHFSFMRRSFRRDTLENDPQMVVSNIHDFWLRCKNRDISTIRRDRKTLEALLRELCD
jgi:hypothetical protein